MQMGRVDWASDMCIFYGDNVPRRDRALIMNVICSSRRDWDGKSQPSLIEELDARGYDLETLQFSIEKKKVTQ